MNPKILTDIMLETHKLRVGYTLGALHTSWHSIIDISGREPLLELGH